MPWHPNNRYADDLLRARDRARASECANIGCDYTDDEVEFMTALHAYKIKYRRPYPACSEVLAVLRSLGYAKAAPPPADARAGSAILGPLAGLALLLAATGLAAAALLR